MIRSALAIPCVLVMAWVSWGAGAKPSSNWENLSILRPGEKIQVMDTAQKKHSGRFSSVTNTAIVLHEKRGDETIQRENVARVTAGSHHARNALIGAAVGAGAGAGAGAASGQCKSGCIGGISRGDVVGVSAGLGAIVGAVIGAILPAHNTIYRAS
jgi:hypothetical protein